MADGVTHTFFAQDVYEKLSTKSKSYIKGYERSFEIYNQGHDVFFYDYRKKYRNLGKYFHKNNTQKYFINMVKYIKENRLENNPELISYLYGNICHYALDLNIHPYITYKAGFYDKKRKKETKKYNGKHSEVEYYLGAYLIDKREHVKPNKLNLYKFCLRGNKVSTNLTDMLDSVFYDTYNIKNCGIIYKRSLNRMKRAYVLFRNDKRGIKKKIYNLHDKLTFKTSERLASKSYVVKLNKNYYYLNLDNRTWNHPRYKTEKHTESALDLYDKAIKLSLSLINAVNNVLYNNRSLDSLTKYFTNLSYTSGKDCNDKKQNKYFEL